MQGKKVELRGDWMEAADMIRSLVEVIILTPSEDELKIDVRGELAGIFAVSFKTKTPATRTGVSQVKVVAGAGFELTTFLMVAHPTGSGET